ncbi:MAG TPA: hypothetical protein VI795_01955 [Patescibacteria group bacterium]|nr:hypothetical protein [Patescibacteria group bacterium]
MIQEQTMPVEFRVGHRTNDITDPSWVEKISTTREQLGIQAETRVAEAARVSAQTSEIFFPSISIEAGLKNMLSTVRDGIVFYPELPNNLHFDGTDNQVRLGMAHQNFNIAPPPNLTGEVKRMFAVQAKQTVQSILESHRLDTLDRLMEHSKSRVLPTDDGAIDKQAVAVLLDSNLKAVRQGMRNLETLSQGRIPKSVNDETREKIELSQKMRKDFKLTVHKGAKSAVISATVGKDVEEAYKKLKQRATRNLAIAGGGSVGITFMCGVVARPLPIEVSSTQTATSTAETSTSTPELPAATSMKPADVQNFLSSCKDKCEGVRPEDVASFDFGAEQILFFTDTDGVNVGRIKGKDGVWQPIYGGYAPDGSFVTWLRPTTEVTPVAPNLGVIGSENVFLIDLNNLSNEKNYLTAHYTSPDSKVFDFKISISSTGKVDFAKPIKFEVPPSIPEATSTPEVKMTLEDWEKVFTGGVIIGHFDGKEYKTESLFDGKDYIIMQNPTEIMILPSGTEIMILNPSGEITIFANPDEAAKRAGEGAIIVIPDPNIAHNDITDAVVYALNSAFRQWEKDKNSTVHAQFGEFNPTKYDSVMIFIDNIPYTTDVSGRIICPILEPPKYYVVVGEGMNYRSDEVGITDLIYWLDQLISKGYLGISVKANQEVLDFAYPPSK